MDHERLTLDVQSDLMAAARRYVPEVIAELPDVLVVSRPGALLNEATANGFEAEARVILAYHLPPGTEFELDMTFRACDGEEIARRVKGRVEGGPESIVGTVRVDG